MLGPSARVTARWHVASTFTLLRQLLLQCFNGDGLLFSGLRFFVQYLFHQLLRVGLLPLDLPCQLFHFLLQLPVRMSQLSVLLCEQRSLQPTRQGEGHCKEGPQLEMPQPANHPTGPCCSPFSCFGLRLG